MSEAGATSDAVRAFMEEIVSAGLLSDGEVRQFWLSLDPASRPSTTSEFVGALVATGLITEFQASALLEDRFNDVVFANYVILDKIGAGGMGQVFLARDRSTRDVVALKTLVNHKIDSDEAIERFRREILAIVRLEHPNIVAAYDVGREGKSYFFTMEYLKGQDLATLVNAHGPLSIPQAVTYVRQAATGLAWAHRQRVIHRDVKPSNLFVDGSGTVKVLDLGLARLVEGVDEDHSSGFTNAIIGTANFISPEQARDTHDADARSDVYSLGCTLYWLLTRSPPFPRKTQLQRLLAHESAEIPSLRRVRDDVSQEFDDVFRRMMAKDPDDRQQSMHEVISELTTAARGAVSISVDQGKEPRTERDLRDFLQTISATTSMTEDESPLSSETTTDRLSGEVTGIEPDPVVAENDEPPSWHWKVVALLVCIGMIGICGYLWRVPVPSPTTNIHPPVPRFELRHRTTVSTRTGRCSSISFSSDGLLLAAAEGPTLRLWESDRGIGRPPILGHTKSITCVDFHPRNGAVVTGSADGTVRTWNLNARKEQHRLSSEHGPIRCTAYSPDGELVAAGCDDGTVLLWDLQNANDPQRFLGNSGAVLAIKFTSDGNRLVAGGTDQIIHLWDVESPQSYGQLTGHNHEIRELEFLEPGGELVSASGADTGEIRVWDLKDLRQLRHLPYQFGIIALCVSPSGDSIGLAVYDGARAIVYLVDTHDWISRRWIRSLVGVSDLAYSPDAKHLCVALADGVIQFWNLDTQTIDISVHGNCEATQCLAFLPDGLGFASAGRGGSIKLWDAMPAKELFTMRNVHESEVHALAFSREGDRLVSGSLDRRIVVWDRNTQQIVVSLDHRNGVPQAVRATGFSPDDSEIVFGGGEGESGFLRILNVETKTITQHQIGFNSVVSSVAYSPDGAVIAAGSYDGTIRLWDPNEDSPEQTFNEHDHWVYTVAFSPNSRKLASAGEGHVVVVRELESDRITKLKGHSSAVNQILFLDDRFVISASDDPSIRIWDTENGEEVKRWQDGEARKLCLAYSRDNQLLAVGRHNGTIDLFTIMAER